MTLSRPKGTRVLWSVDPGKRGIGLAGWVNGKLVSAKYAGGSRSGEDAVCWAAFNGVEGDELAIEFPQVYGGPRNEDPNDLLQLAAVVGAISSRFNHVAVYRPRQWKGQVPKPKKRSEPYIIAERCKRRLSPDELAAVEIPGDTKLSWDVWDAVGIGLKHLGRM
jgi:hypothetical protein